MNFEVSLYCADHEKGCKTLIQNYPYKEYYYYSDLDNTKLTDYTFQSVKKFSSVNNQENSEKKNFLIATSNDKIVGLLTWEYLSWDTAHFGFKCSRINHFIISEGDYNDRLQIAIQLLNHIIEICHNYIIKFLSVKINSQDTASIHALELSGFRVIDSEFVLCLQPNQPDLQRKAFSNDQNGYYRLQRISHHKVSNLSNLYNLYTLDRFHRDVFFPKEKSDALWNSSLENCCIKYADQVVLIFEKALPVAFVSIRRNLETIAFWNQSVDLLFLVGVSPKHRNKHLGTWALQNAMEWSLEHTNYIETETQSCNYAALALYQKNGLKICNSRLTFHKWL